MSATSPSTADLVHATSTNRSFSHLTPGLQTAVDSTSLGTFKECPRKYLLSNIFGYQTRMLSVHLTFGTLLHSGRERYDHHKSQGIVHEVALALVVRWALCATWDVALGRPWASAHKSKNRIGLVRTLVWYLDRFGDDDVLETVQLANGKPATELSFSFPSGLTSQSGESWLLCGHLDRIAKMGSDFYISDIKSTEHAIDGHWFSRFSPDNQFSLYTLAGRVAFGFPVQALIVDAVQIGVTFSRFERGVVSRTESQCNEWLADTHWWLRQMEDCALQVRWPANDKSCGLYGGCPFRPVCAKPESARQVWLDNDYSSRKWDPLERRGDI